MINIINIIIINNLLSGVCPSLFQQQKTSNRFGNAKKSNNLRTESFRKVTVNCQEIHLYRAGDPRAVTVGKFEEYRYISSEWLRTCERYPGVAKSYLIMRRTPPAQVPTHQVSDEIRNYVWFFLVRHGPLVKPWWHRNELAEIY